MLVNVEVTTKNKTSFSKCDAIQLLNTLEDIVNRADIKICDQGGKVQYILEVKQPE